MIKKYLDAYGGIEAIPYLWRKAIGIYRATGWSGLFRCLHASKQKVTALEIPSIEDIMEKDTWWKWRNDLQNSFSGEDSILIIDHMYGGGANSYRDKRIEHYLRNDWNVLLLTWDMFNKMLICTVYLRCAKLVFSAADISTILHQDLMQFSKILVNNLCLWSSKNKTNPYGDIPRILSLICDIKTKNDAYLEFALHDYYPICPSYTLTTRNNQFCGLPKNIEICNKCLRQNKLQFKLPKEFNLIEWRDTWKRFFAKTNEIRAFAKYPLGLYTEIFALPHHMCRIIPHTLLAEWTQAYRTPHTKCMRIGVIGDITPHKGAAMVQKVAQLLQGEEQIIVIGSLQGCLPPRTRIHGKYKREELPNLLNQYEITVAFIPSIWPETFCYTAQECASLGIPVVVFPLGAQKERIANYPKGLVAEDLTPGSALAALRKLDGERVD